MNVQFTCKTMDGPMARLVIDHNLRRRVASRERRKPAQQVCKNRTILVVLIAAFTLVLRSELPALTFLTLHSFAEALAYTNGAVMNADGASPLGDLIVSGNTLYGTTVNGGSSGMGTVFRANTDGTGITTLHTFTPIAEPDFTNSDGINPYAGLTLSGNALYGTTVNAGSFGRGTVFKVNTDGTGFTTIYNFSGGSDGGYPYCTLILSGNTLYGTTPCCYGGTVFAVSRDGTEFTTLYSFSGGIDGSGPSGGLVLSSNTLYGTTVGGGTSFHGTVFALNTDGTGFTTLYNFAGDFDGVGPYDALILASNTLYGTTIRGGSSNNGTVFAVETSGTGFRTLHTFTGGSDGGLSGASLVLSSNTLYGTTQEGGTFGKGTVFAVNTDGTGFTNLHSFTNAPSYTNSDGAYPDATLAVSSHTLYGTARAGGIFGNGTLFSISLGGSLPTLAFSTSQKSLVFTWPANASGVVLQSATNLASPVWTVVSTSPVIINGQNTVTNPISSTQQFFRLSQ